MKVEKVTPDKPEVAILARKLGVSIGDAFLQWFRIYAWADGVTCPGFVPNLSLCDVDQLARAMPKTAAHLASKEIGWLREASDGVHFAKWDRHNGKSAKARALDAEKKRKYRGESGDLSQDCPAPEGTESGLDKRRQEENQLLKSNREAIGNASRLPSQLPSEVLDVKAPDLRDVDWPHVVSMAEAVARKVRPATPEDRRNWFRFGVLTETTFSEAWLMDAAEAVARAKETRRTKQAHLYGVLRSKAGESGISPDVFTAMLKAIRIPDEVWNLEVLGVRE